MGLLSGGNKSSSVTNNTENNDASTLQAITGVRNEGDGNTITVTDGEAVKNALIYAQHNADGSFKTTSDLLNITGTIVDSLLKGGRETTQEALKAVSEGRNQAIEATGNAYAAAQNAGVNPKALVIVVAAIVAIFMLKR